MKNIRSIYIYVILINLMFSSILSANKESVLVYALEAMPYCGIVDEKPAGLAVDILNEATNYGAPSFSFIFDIPWVRAQKRIQTADDDLVAIIPFSRSKSRELKYKWIAELFPTQSHLYSYKRDSPVNSAKEAKTLNIGVVRGHAIISVLESMGIYNLDTDANNASMNAMKLFNHRIDAIADSDLISIYNWKQIGQKTEDLQEGIPIGDITYVFIAGNHRFPKDIAQSIYEAIERMKKDGTYQNILDRWIK